MHSQVGLKQVQAESLPFHKQSIMKSIPQAIIESPALAYSKQVQPLLLQSWSAFPQATGLVIGASQGLPFHKRKAFHKQLVIPQDPFTPPFTNPKSRIPDLPPTQPA